MSDAQEKLDLQKAFEKPGARRRFKKLVGLRRITDRDIEEMIATDDAGLFVEYLDIGGQPIFEVRWGAINHGNSGSFQLYHFDGQFFVSMRTEWANELAGPFGKALEAAKKFPGIFAMEYMEEYGSAGAVRFSTDWSGLGNRLLSRRTKEKIFEELTCLVGSPLAFYWCEAKSGRMFKDLFDDDAGKALMDLHKAQKDGALDAISAAELRWNAQTKDDRIDGYVMGEEAKHFTSAFDSFLMKVPLDAKGKLARFRAHWVRICLPHRAGKKTIGTVVRITRPERLFDHLVPAAESD